jgi:hypothetical protein
MATANLTPEYLHQLFTYDPQDGSLRWKVARSPNVSVGKIAGSLCTGYKRVKIDGFSYLVHRLIWLMVTGAWPKADLDHINGIRTDNRFTNLREASRALNCQNQRRAQSDNRLGILGVWAYKKRFVAAITVNGKQRHLGVFDTAEQAHNAYVAAKRVLHLSNTL